METCQITGPGNFPDYDQWSLIQIKVAFHANRLTKPAVFGCDANHSPLSAPLEPRKTLAFRYMPAGSFRLLRFSNRNIGQGNQVQNNPDSQKQASCRGKGNKRQWMVPEQADRLYHQPENNKLAGNTKLRMERICFVAHYCTGQNLTLSKLSTLWIVSWHPDVRQETLLLLISAMVCGSTVWMAPSSKLREPS